MKAKWDDLVYHYQELERLWQTRPFVVIACAGYSDEHVQFYHPQFSLEFPAFTWDGVTGLRRHPDSPLDDGYRLNSAA